MEQFHVWLEVHNGGRKWYALETSFSFDDAADHCSKKSRAEAFYFARCASKYLKNKRPEMPEYMARHLPPLPDREHLRTYASGEDAAFEKYAAFVLLSYHYLPALKIYDLVSKFISCGSTVDPRLQLSF